MPKAIHEPTPSRRGVLGGAAALLAGTALPIAATAETAIPATADAGEAPVLDQDAKLIAACGRYVRAEAKWRNLLDVECGAEELAPGSPAHRAAEAATVAVADGERDAALEEVNRLQATTLAGLRAKAAVVVSFYEPDAPEQGSIMEEALWEVLCVMAGKPELLT